MFWGGFHITLRLLCGGTRELICSTNISTRDVGIPQRFRLSDVGQMLTGWHHSENPSDRTSHLIISSTFLMSYSICCGVTWSHWYAGVFKETFLNWRCILSLFTSERESVGVSVQTLTSVSMCPVSEMFFLRTQRWHYPEVPEKVLRRIWTHHWWYHQKNLISLPRVQCRRCVSETSFCFCQTILHFLTKGAQQCHWRTVFGCMVLSTEPCSVCWKTRYKS